MAKLEIVIQDKKHYNQAEKAFNEVRTLLGKANAAMAPSNFDKDANIRKGYEKWFGTISQANVSQVRDVIHSMLVQLRDRYVRLEEDLTEERGTFAYVRGVDVGGGLEAGVTIYLGPKFFTIPLLGYNCQVGTIIHEVSHLVGQTADHQYGEADCLALAKHDPAEAVTNADNYEFYVETFKVL